MAAERKVPKRIAQIIYNSLKGGVVPRIGLPYIMVGRRREAEALLYDLELVSEGGATFRFIEGRYGSGKSFLLQAIRNNAMDRGFITTDADLSPERRLHGTKGQGLSTYKELVANLSVKARPEGGALTMILDKWIMSVQTEAETTGRSEDEIMRSITDAMNELVHGFDFANVIMQYYRAAREDDPELKANALKWLRGEYSTKTDARKDLGVSAVISDDDWYEYLKLFGAFFRRAGYEGMFIFIDEMINIYKIPNAIARNYNYEKLLAMYNDAMQGKAHYIGTVMCGTPQAIEDPRRGVYSYEALRSRLNEGRFGGGKYQDLLAPVIKLEPLTGEEMLVLTEKLADIHADLFGYERELSENDLADFISLEYSRIGAESHVTPREIIRDFIELLDIIRQNPGTSPRDILKDKDFSFAAPDSGIDEQFASFTL